MNLSNYFSSFKKSLGYGARIRPTRDWFVLLSLAVLFLAVSIYWNIHLFGSLENGKQIGTTPTTSVPATAASITSVQTVFQKRATEESDYQHAYTFIDPSLGGS